MTITINGTTGISGVDGSSATPAVQGVDTNTGIFYGTDIVGVSTGGSERMRVDASGNVGIGTSSAGYGDLTVKRQATTGTNCTFSLVSGSLGSGRLFFGNTQNAAGEYDGFIQYDQGNRIMQFGTAQSERMRIDSSGNLLVGTTTTAPTGVNAISLGLAGGARTFCASGTGFFNQILFSNANGAVGAISTNGSATTFSTSSDYRLKENIQPMQNALATVAQLNPVTYKWKADGSDGQGFIAHELQAVVPDCVTGEKDAVDEEGNPVYQGIDTIC